MDSAEAIDLLAATPASTGLLFDFDGTLSDIVDRPEDARAVTGAAAVLTALARTFRVVAVISGRSLEDLRDRFSPNGVVLLGSYGRERSDRPGPRPHSQGWEGAAVAAAARTRDMPGVLVETKSAGVSLHYRMAPERAEDIRHLALELADAFGLEIRPGRMVDELVSPGPGKGEAVADLGRDHGLRGLLYAGDDVADLEGFQRARELVPAAVRVAVASEEAPPELREQAELVMSSPTELVAFLREVARAGATGR